MEKVQLAREFKLSHNEPVNCLTFSSDNKFLLSSHTKNLKVWSVVHNNLFKEFILQNDIVNMRFT